MSAILIALGLVLLFLGAEVLVRGAVALARRLGISPLVIGLTIVGFGTSSPELVVSLNAALVGRPAIAVGNVVGSNIANMMLIMGAAALIFPIAVHPMAVRRDGAFMSLATVAFVACVGLGPLTVWHGAAMVAALAGYLVYSLRQDMAGGDAAALHAEEVEEISPLPRGIWATGLSILGGIVGLVVGARALVDGATRLAAAAGISDEVIGLTLVAVGTSLPELATALVAAYRRHSDVCLGNVLGSNIFNLLGIMGAAALVAPIPFGDKIATFDVPVLLAVTALTMVFVITGRRLNRWEGGALLVGFAVYVACQFLGLSGTTGAAP